MKPALENITATSVMSPPTRGRGLKHLFEDRINTGQSRPPRGGVD